MGRPGLSPHLRLEQRFVLVRWIGLIVMTPALLLFDLVPVRIYAAYAILVIAAIYNFQVQRLIESESSRLDNGYITTIGDGILSISIILIGGGFSTSFNYVLYTTTMAAAMRYGWGPSMIVIGVYFLLDLITSLTGSAGLNGDFIIRSLFLLLMVLLASYLQDQARIAEAALARQLERARALNESSRALSATLDINTVMGVIAHETRRLMGAEEATLGMKTDPNGPMIFSDSGVGKGALRPRVEAAIQSGQMESFVNTASDPEPYVIVPLDARGNASGYVGVMRAAQAEPFEPPEYELLVSFIERAGLALENASLYKTIDDRSHDLKRAYGDLAAAHQELLGIDEMKTNFIANVSHELRTPLTSIRSFSELLLSYAVDDDTKREFLGIINTESERLTRLINDVLDITKIEAGQVEWQMEEFDLRDLLTSSARSFSGLVMKQGLEFDLIQPEEPLQVRADRDRIHQVVANLMGNALKFTESGKITLYSTVEDNLVCIHVQDTGMGIAQQDQSLIFEKFHQVGDTLTDKPHGTGLGLSICRDIIYYHGGQIRVESELGRGSTFTFTLPLV
ncbi:MAG: ATP-binding protein [Caldilineaceae bacterium]